MERQRTGILLFDAVEVLDFCGPFEVFSVTRLDETRRGTDPSPFEVLLVAEQPGPITATGGLQVLPHCTCSDCPDLDLLVVPGGQGTRREVGNPALVTWIANRAAAAQLVAAVCTGSFLLAEAGVLDGRRATTHWRSLQRLASAYPAVTVDHAQHVVHDGSIITSAGISAGIDMALHIVQRCYGQEIALSTARHMEYRYPADNTRRVSLG